MVGGDTAEAILIGDSPGGEAGISLASGADLNGDGWPDLAVGAWYAGEGPQGSGRVHVVFGPISGEVDLGSADVILEGEAGNDLAGASVVVGDFSGDGVADLVVGAPYNDGAGLNAGAVYVVFGPLGTDRSLGDADLILLGASAGDAAGNLVASAGDVDGDGLRDLLVTAPLASRGALSIGVVHVVRGPFSAGVLSLENAYLTYEGEDTTDFAGIAAGPAGDVDGDGCDDILVGASGAGPTAGGAVYFASAAAGGTFDLSTAYAVYRFDDFPNLTAGGAVAWVHDLDSDGYSEYLIGAEDYEYLGSETGAAFLIYGPVTAGEHVWSEIDGSFMGMGHEAAAGQTVAAAGDADADGRPDLLIASPRVDNWRGRVNLIPGDAR